MYFIIFLITFLIKATVPTIVNEFEADVNGILIKRAYFRNMRADNVLFTCPDVPQGGSGNVCADDCQTLLACVSGVQQPIFISNCSVISPSNPYCIPGTTACSNKGDQHNPQCIAEEEIPTFKCTSNGYFPDPTDCTIYHKCTRDCQETFKCPTNHVFSATNTKCKLRKHFTGCSTVDCTQSMYQYVPYPGHKSYYAYCEDDGITMYKCDDINNLQFNPKTLDCDFICKSAGWFPHYKNCQQYYECYKYEKPGCHHYHGHKMFKSRLHTCPQDCIFDSKRRKCVEVKSECDDCVSKPIIGQTTTTTTNPTPIISSQSTTSRSASLKGISPI